MKPARGELHGVIFDVDGTLVDSERDGHRVAFNEAFADLGLADVWDVETYGRLLTVAGGAHRLVRWFESQGTEAMQARQLAVAVHLRKTAIMRELVMSGAIPPRPGAEALIETVLSSGRPVHVATTGSRGWVEPLLSRTFGARFDVVVTGSEVPELKPSPAVYREVMIRAGLGPRSAVAIEDSANGVRSAGAAGLPCLMVRNHYTRHDDTAGATLVCDGMEDATMVDWIRTRLPAPSMW